MHQMVFNRERGIKECDESNTSETHLAVGHGRFVLLAQLQVIKALCTRRNISQRPVWQRKNMCTEQACDQCG